MKIYKKDAPPNADPVVKMYVWVIWSYVTLTVGVPNFTPKMTGSIRSGDAAYEHQHEPAANGNAWGTAWRFKFSLLPKQVVVEDDTNKDIPDLTGIAKADVPGYNKDYVFRPNVKGDSAEKRWDVSRQIKVTMFPGVIPVNQLFGVPTAFCPLGLKDGDTPVVFPPDQSGAGADADAEGNDDPQGKDEDDNPYAASVIDPNDSWSKGIQHDAGELTSIDGPRTPVLKTWAWDPLARTWVTGRTISIRYDFREFIRVQLGNRTGLNRSWYRISDFEKWHFYMKSRYVYPDDPNGGWLDDGSVNGKN